MVALNSLIVNLQTYLGKQSDLDEVTFVPAFAGKVKSMPLEGPVVRSLVMESIPPLTFITIT